MFQTLVPFPIKILMKRGGIDIFIFSILCSYTEGPNVRWLQHVGITPLSKHIWSAALLSDKRTVVSVAQGGGWVKELELLARTPLVVKN
jgi:hypothetical protein